MEREYCENCGAKDSLRAITKDDYLNIYGVISFKEFRENAIERKKQLKEKKEKIKLHTPTQNRILLVRIIFGLLGLGLIITGIYIITAGIYNIDWRHIFPTGITLLIVGFIILAVASKGEICLECANC